MLHQRASGILLHLTSLPGQWPVGDLGVGARQFVDFLAAGRQAYWQTLPLGPTVHGDSPYSSYSAFAGNYLLISIDDLADTGWLTSDQADELLGVASPVSPDGCDYKLARRVKQQALRWAYAMLGQRESAVRADFDKFRQSQAEWLEDYALFTACMRHFESDDWSTWDADLTVRKPESLSAWAKRLGSELEFEQFVQYLFFGQWAKLRQYGAERGVHLFGDMPIFLAHGSSDVWSHQEMFHLNESGRETVVAGVPPDYFSKTGQLWGNPLYDWQRLAADGYHWWTRRFAHTFECFDLVRIDHFRGFQAYWEIPASAKTAAGGKWVEGPGAAPFLAARKQIGELAIVAEDLGLITDEVHALREQLGFPGMRVLQFGFDQDHDDYHRPNAYPDHSVAYTGTHDNQTVQSWYDSRRKDPAFLRRLAEYVQLDGNSQPIHWGLLEAVMRSSSRLAIAPLQDLLGLRDDARMNRPGKAKGNWKWRCTADQLTSQLAERLAELTQDCGRGLA